MPEKKPKTARRVFTLILAYILFCVTGGVVASGFLLPAVFGANTVAQSLTAQLKAEDIDFELADLPQQSRMYARDGKTVIATFYEQNRIIVPLKNISDYMQKAVVAREDHRFFEHTGIDPQGIARAFVQTYIKKGDTQGGSTLTQQYVKNILIDQSLEKDDPIAAYHAQEETIARKLREMLIAVELEKNYSKAEILQGYLNIAQFGKNTYGVETAAQRYFSKSAKDLNLVEAATIAAITKNPTSYDPTVNPDEAEKQRNITLDLMSEWGFVDKSKTDEAKKIPIEKTLHRKTVAVGCQSAGNAAYFCDYALHQIENSPKFGKTLDDRKKLIKQGGLNIYTTLDVNAQNSAWKAVTDNLPVNDPSGYENIIAAVKPGTGEVLALAQNRIYDVAGAPNTTKTSVNYAVDRADGGGSGFQVGSTWKPINFAAWLKAGHSMNESLATYTSYPVSSFPGAGRASEVWELQNSGGGTVSPETPLQALNQSHNTTQASMAQIIGLNAIADMAKTLGYHRPDGQAIGKLSPSMVIGTMPASPLTMANIYATIAGNGVECTPIAITKMTSASGKNYEVPSANCHQAISKEIAHSTAYAMNLNVTQGIAKDAQLSDGRRTYAKTGTSEQNALATSGFIPQVAAFAIITNAENSGQNLYGTINGVYRSTWYGSDIALPTWKQFMEGYISSAKLPADNSYGLSDETGGSASSGTSSGSESGTSSGTSGTTGGTSGTTGSTGTGTGTGTEGTTNEGQ
ncbi:carboxypeptidase [Bifidobacterium primatium]|uniref:Carboxypeptidase n=1 Tax=Bifidobacterium primatium TaxID=2045438 RepID=A0A2M9HBX0_9BIFI|nr:transglycosylase domain-containing protein [Bifidobacterium primatium]PJM74314.1 carboxypeptidase [Bifidobacterium primatium]